MLLFLMLDFEVGFLLLSSGFRGVGVVDDCR